MKSKLQLITPEIAKEHLSKNINNYRIINTNTVNAYAADMKSNNWKRNGESIKFNQSGWLVDGQHRLLACIKSGRNFYTIVTTGVEDDVTTFDVGKNRTLAQIARNGNLPPAVANNTILGAVSMLLRGEKNATSNIPKQKVIETVKSEIQEWADVFCCITRGSNTSIAKKSPIALAAYVLIKQQTNIDDLSQFFSIVNSGFPIDGIECSPAIVLRNYILSEKYKAEAHYSNGRTILFSYTISAFNDFKAGSKRRIRYSVDPAHISLLNELKSRADM